MAAKYAASALIPAVGYLRKSTKGKGRDRDGKIRERQEKSISQQRAEILKFAEGRFEILRWYDDEGVSGWKREAARPGFARMLADARELRDFRAILSDDADRFTRASWRKAVRDVDELAEAGVEIIACVKDGEFKIHNENDPGEAHRLIAIAMANHEYSRKLSRRVSLARRNAAVEGKRTGAAPPFGYVRDGRNGLKVGDPEQVETVLWVFDQAAHARPIKQIVSDLNRRGVPGPRGGAWLATTVRALIRNRVYVGDLVYGSEPVGQFHRLDADGQVVEADKVAGRGKVIINSGVFPPIVTAAVWKTANDRIDLAGRDRSRRKSMYVLSGILVCDRCGSKLTGCRPHKANVYRCPSESRIGKGGKACPQWQVREDMILPFLLRTLDEEIGGLATLSQPKFVPPRRKAAKRAKFQAERDALAAKAEAWRVAALEMDAEDRQKTLRDIAELKERIREIDAELSAPEQDDDTAERRAFFAALGEHMRGMIEVPKEPVDWDDPPFQFVDKRKVNEALRGLGAEVRLTWRSEEVEMARGTRRVHVVDKVWLRLGQKSAPVTLDAFGTPKKAYRFSRNGNNSSKSPSWPGSTS